MPLTKGNDPKTTFRNIREMRSAGYPQNQAVAAAMNVAHKALGGTMTKSVSGPRSPKLHTGPIHSVVAGRTDHLKMNVPSGSYVIPADIISAMGEGNTMAGFKLANKVFSKPVSWMTGAPYQSPSTPYGMEETPYGISMPHKASGGSAENGIPIVAAGGEYVVSPEDVLQLGDGDMDAGHRHMDEFVKKMRARTVKTLQKLPGPKRD